MGKDERGDPVSDLWLAPRTHSPKARVGGEQAAKAITSALSYQLTAAGTVLGGKQECESVEESNPHLQTKAAGQSDCPVQPSASQHPPARGQQIAMGHRRSWSDQGNASLRCDVLPLQMAGRVPRGHHPAASWLLLFSQLCGTIKISNTKNTCLLILHALIRRQRLDNQFRNNHSSSF